MNELIKSDYMSVLTHRTCWTDFLTKMAKMGHWSILSDFDFADIIVGLHYMSVVIIIT